MHLFFPSKTILLDFYCFFPFFCAEAPLLDIICPWNIVFCFRWSEYQRYYSEILPSGTLWTSLCILFKTVSSTKWWSASKRIQERVKIKHHRGPALWQSSPPYVSWSKLVSSFPCMAYKMTSKQGVSFQKIPHHKLTTPQPNFFPPFNLTLDKKTAEIFSFCFENYGIKIITHSMMWAFLTINPAICLELWVSLALKKMINSEITLTICSFQSSSRR